MVSDNHHIFLDSTELFVSIVSFCEISIKRSLGKFDISYSTRDLIKNN